MSDLVQSIGMVFDDVGSDISDLASGFLDNAAKAFDAGTLDDTTTPDVQAPAVDTAPAADTTSPATSATPDTQPPAPVSEGSAPLTGMSGPPASSLQSAPTWFQNLSPGAQAILAKGAVGGAAGLIAALAQKHQLDEQRRREEQKRDDKIRRGYVAPISDDAFKPKGVIDAARG